MRSRIVEADDRMAQKSSEEGFDAPLALPANSRRTEKIGRTDRRARAEKGSPTFPSVNGELWSVAFPTVEGGRSSIVEADDRTWEKRGASTLLSGIKTTWSVAFPTVEGGKTTYPPDGGGAAYSFADDFRGTEIVACEFA